MGDIKLRLGEKVVVSKRPLVWCPRIKGRAGRRGGSLVGVGSKGGRLGWGLVSSEYEEGGSQGAAQRERSGLSVLLSMETSEYEEGGSQGRAHKLRSGLSLLLLLVGSSEQDKGYSQVVLVDISEYDEGGSHGAAHKERLPH